MEVSSPPLSPHGQGPGVDARAPGGQSGGQMLHVAREFCDSNLTRRLLALSLAYFGGLAAWQHADQGRRVQAEVADNPRRSRFPSPVSRNVVLQQRPGTILDRHLSSSILHHQASVRTASLLPGRRRYRRPAPDARRGHRNQAEMMDGSPSSLPLWAMPPRYP